MNTIHTGKDAPSSVGVFGEEKGGEILLWAGAKSQDKTAIEASPFYVDKNGNVFANSGHFEGAIISKSSIEASEIITATITGKGETNPALVIKDASVGIDFQDNNGKPIFRVADELIEATVSEIKFNSNFKIDDKGALSIPEVRVGQENEGIEIGKNSISYLNSVINFEKGFKYSQGESGFEVNTQETIVNTDSMSIKGLVKYGDLIEYKPVYDENDKLVGYDLFIKEE